MIRAFKSNPYVVDPAMIRARHNNVAVHCSPAFEPKEGDIITAGQCRPLAKTVRFNVLKALVYYFNIIYGV